MASKAESAERLAKNVEWVLDDLAYAAPEDVERWTRGLEALRAALRRYRDG